MTGVQPLYLLELLVEFLVEFFELQLGQLLFQFLELIELLIEFLVQPNQDYLKFLSVSKN